MKIFSCDLLFCDKNSVTEKVICMSMLFHLGFWPWSLLSTPVVGASAVLRAAAILGAIAILLISMTGCAEVAKYLSGECIDIHQVLFGVF